MKQTTLHSKEKRLSGRVVLSGLPQKKQKEFFMSTQKYIAYGGARGGGKSWALRRKIILLALKYHGISILLIRRTYAELRDNHIRTLQAELGKIAQYRDVAKTFTFPSGSIIRLGYMDSENDVLQYQGQEFDIIAVDEATQLTEYQFQTLKGCLRGANSFPKRMYLTCNPGGVGHGWVKRLFIDRDFREGENPEDYRFIQALVYDNKVLLDKNPDYLEQLKSLPASLKGAWLCGEWERFEGQFFREFDYGIHTCDVFEIPKEWKRYCAVDYGLDMLACVFCAVDSEGNVYVYDEIHKDNLIVTEAAELINRKKDGVISIIAPSDLWSRQKDSGKSIAELFAEKGVYFTKLTSERIDGWMCLRELMKVYGADDGERKSRLNIMRNCVNLIRCIPLLLHSKKRVGDASTMPHNITHAPDALRYFAVSRFMNSPSSHRQVQRTKLKEQFSKPRFSSEIST